METLPRAAPSPSGELPAGHPRPVVPRAGDQPGGFPIPSPGRKLSVLKVAPTFFFADYGCHVRILEEARVLQDMGHRVVLCTYPSGRDMAGIDTRRAVLGPWNPGVKVGPARRKLYLDVLLSLRAGEVALRTRPDIIHAHLHDGALLGIPISRAVRAPLVFDFQGSMTSEMLDHGFLRPGSLMYQPYRLMEQIINRGADAIITSTANSAHLLVKEFGVPARKVFTVSDCVNTDVFVPRRMMGAENGHDNQLDALRRRLGVPAGYKVVVYVGLLQEYQGISHLLRAAKEVAQRHLDVHFLVMGYPGLEKYMNMAHELGISNRVTFTGRVAYEELPSHLALGDVAVSPKMSATEGNGKLVNYMSMGLPTVTFDTPVSREILGELGIYAAFGDHHSLAGELESILYAGRDAGSLGDALRARAASLYSWRQGGELIQKIYESLL